MANENSIYVCVKGIKGKYAIVINDCYHNEIISFSKSEIFENGKPTPPIISDIIGIRKGLEYIAEHLGEGKIPSKPVVSVFTTYENNYNICSGNKIPDKCSQQVYGISQIIAQLSRFSGDKDHVKFCWSPKGTNLSMNFLETRLKLIPKN